MLLVQHVKKERNSTYQKEGRQAVHTTLVRSGNEDETEEQFDGTWVERTIPGKVMVSAYRKYDVTPEVIEKARKLGMYGAVERHLKKMARLAARITYPRANYRYQNYLFLIQDDKIVDILYFSDADRALYERRTYRERRAGLSARRDTASDVQPGSDEAVGR